MTNTIKNGRPELPEFGGFILQWEDLPEDLRERKITTYVAHQEIKGAYAAINQQDGLDETERQFIKRRDAEKVLVALFPIYL